MLVLTRKAGEEIKLSTGANIADVTLICFSARNGQAHLGISAHPQVIFPDFEISEGGWHEFTLNPKDSVQLKLDDGGADIDVGITCVRVSRDSTRIGIDAPTSVKIMRKEVLQKLSLLKSDGTLPA
jgi:sRNA-binding carbon storage regulator CsrA